MTTYGFKVPGYPVRLRALSDEAARYSAMQVISATLPSNDDVTDMGHEDEGEFAVADWGPICCNLAERYKWDARKISRMTPAQLAMYSAGVRHGGRRDRRTGRRVVRVANMREAAEFVQGLKEADGGTE